MMKKKIIWITGIFLVFFVLSLLGLSFFAQGFLKGERLRSMITSRAETFTGRKVGIKDIRFSLFKGIVVKELSIKEQDGTNDFGTVREFVLDCRLLPLLRKQLVISRIEVIAPTIHIRRDWEGRFNFDTIIENSRQAKDSAQSGRDDQQLPFSVTTDSISVKDLGLKFLDDTQGLPAVTAQADVKAKVSMGKDMKEVAATVDITLKEMKTVIGSMPISVKGTIGIDSTSIKINLNILVDKDAVVLAGTIQDYRTTPNIMMNLTGKNMDLSRLKEIGNAPESVSSKPKRRDASGETKKQDKKELKVIVAGEAKFDAVKYANYTLKNFLVGYRYRDSIVALEPFRMHIAGGDQMRTEGDLQGNAQFVYMHGMTPPEIKKSVLGKGTLTMNMLQMKESRLTDAIALFTGLNDLRSTRFDTSRFTFDVKGQKIFLKGTMDSPLVRLNPGGSIGFDERLDIVTDLKIAPALAIKLPTAKSGFTLRDEQGWTAVPLKISGTVKNPTVGLNAAGLGKQIERGITGAIGQKLSRDAEDPAQGKEQPQDFIKGLFGK